MNLSDVRSSPMLSTGIFRTSWPYLSSCQAPNETKLPIDAVRDRHGRGLHHHRLYPLEPDEALSDSKRNAANDWFDGTLYSRLNDRKTGRIILIMQRLHEDDLVGHVLGLEPWKVIRFPAIAEEDKTLVIETPYGTRRFHRRADGTVSLWCRIKQPPGRLWQRFTLCAEFSRAIC
jgi:hypothetical protein